MLFAFDGRIKLYAPDQLQQERNRSCSIGLTITFNHQFEHLFQQPNTHCRSRQCPQLSNPKTQANVYCQERLMIIIVVIISSITTCKSLPFMRECCCRLSTLNNSCLNRSDVKLSYDRKFCASFRIKQNHIRSVNRY